MKKTIFLFCLSLFSIQTFAQNMDKLRKELNQIISTKNATVGISLKGIEKQDTLSINVNMKMPMMSVFKFHIALAVLNEVDKGKLALNQKVFIKKEDLKILGAQSVKNSPMEIWI